MKIKTVLFWIVGLAVSAMSVYVWLNSRSAETFPIKDFLMYVGYIVAGLLVLYGIFRLIMYFVNRESDSTSEPFREIVMNNRAKQIWLEEFVKENGIQYVRRIWEDDSPIVPVNPHAVTIRNQRRFADPSQGTPDTFLAFNAIVKEGHRRGMLYAIIQVDRGENWIRDNWDQHIKDHAMYVHQERVPTGSYPLTSPRDAAQRQLSRRIELLEQGYTEDELKTHVDPFIAAEGNGVPARIVVNEPVRSPEPQEVSSGDSSDDGDDEDEFVSIENDIKEYVRRKQ